MKLTVLPDTLTILKLASGDPIPEWALKGEFVSITRTVEELSIVCPLSDVPGQVTQNGPWRALKVNGPLDFSLTGILASLASPLAEAQISIFAISTYDTDYILVQVGDFLRAIQVLKLKGHEVLTPNS